MKRPSPSYLFGLLTFGFLSAHSLRAFGQGGGASAAAAAAATQYPGFSLPTVRGSLNYAVSAAEIVSVGYNGTDTVARGTNIAGDLAYLSISQTHPFSLVYSGGYSFGTSNQPSSFYQNIAASQVVNVSRWNFAFSDSFSYLPQTATTGLSGIPGTGDGGISPISTGSDGLGVLTQSSSRINDAASVSVQRGLTGKTAAHVQGTYTLLHYTGNSGVGVNDSQEAAGAGLSHRISARTSASVNYAYSNYGYSGSGDSASVAIPGTVSQSVNLGVSHQFTRKLSASASAGPQRTTGAGLLSASVNLSASVALSYSGRFTSYSASYNSGSGGGSGVAAGSTMQSVTFSGHRSFGRHVGAGANAGYSRSSGLPTVLNPTSYTTNALVGGVQINRSILRNLSGYFSYTAQRQTVAGPVSSNALNGLTQSFAAGISYSPSGLHFGHQ